MASTGQQGATSVSKVSRVDFHEMLPFVWQGAFFKDCFNRARQGAKSAGDAFIGIDIQLFGIYSSLDAINGANINTESVFDADARTGNDLWVHLFTSKPILRGGEVFAQYILMPNSSAYGYGLGYSDIGRVKRQNKKTTRGNCPASLPD